MTGRTEWAAARGLRITPHPADTVAIVTAQPRPAGNGATVAPSKRPGRKAQGQSRQTVRTAAPRPPVELPCIHRGPPVGTIACGCGGAPVLFGCAKHERCTLHALPKPCPLAVHAVGKEVDRLAAKPAVCVTCQDRLARPMIPAVEILRPTADLCIVTGYTPDRPEWAELAALTIPTMRAYAERHGYGLWVHTQLADPSAHPAWSKIRWIVEALAHHRHVLWIDADAAITNYWWTPDHLMDVGADLVLSTDPIGFNTGVTLWRRSDWSERMLETIWSGRRNGNHLWEQDEIERLLWRGEISGSHVHVVGPGRLNSLAPAHAALKDREWFAWDPGSPIAHYYGTGHDTRRKVVAAGEMLRQKAARDSANDRLGQRLLWIDSPPRAGSQWLVSLAGSVAGCVGLGEAFDPGTVRGRPWGQNVAAWLRGTLGGERLVAGSCHRYEDYDRVPDAAAIAAGRACATHGVVLYRRDLLAQYCSSLLGAPGALQLLPDSPTAVGTVTVDLSDFGRWAAVIQRGIEGDLQRWRGRAAIVLAYEDLIEDLPLSLARLSDLVGLDLTGAVSPLKKHERRPLREAITNYAEARAACPTLPRYRLD